MGKGMQDENGEKPHKLRRGGCGEGFSFFSNRMNKKFRMGRQLFSFFFLHSLLHCFFTSEFTASRVHRFCVPAHPDSFRDPGQLTRRGGVANATGVANAIWLWLAMTITLFLCSRSSPRRAANCNPDNQPYPTAYRIVRRDCSSNVSPSFPSSASKKKKKKKEKEICGKRLAESAPCNLDTYALACSSSLPEISALPAPTATINLPIDTAAALPRSVVDCPSIPSIHVSIPKNGPTTRCRRHDCPRPASALHLLPQPNVPDLRTLDLQI
ncbi:hypothetical protein FN846DRAFT_452502 [Sphaerosporella brunnea]|uniref:Uncharacterized protein n=1 Tax=Sphaerosporella brunnea TaxID=1250544 RepID=A0A5J5F5J8_9PEZI|nr:hypothetical protein FN846DRAFT_452502 [Sphaerosporella brunnea]